MQRHIIRSTERRQYRLLVEYHELPPVFLRSLEYILELFSTHFRLALHLGKAVAYMLRKTLSIPNVWAHTLGIDKTLRMMSIT